jgi:hypothetical protein
MEAKFLEKSQNRDLFRKKMQIVFTIFWGYDQALDIRANIEQVGVLGQNKIS